MKSLKNTNKDQGGSISLIFFNADREFLRRAGLQYPSHPRNKQLPVAQANTEDLTFFLTKLAATEKEGIMPQFPIKYS